MLKTLASVEKRMELLLPLPVKRNANRVMLIDPRAAHHRQCVALDRNAHCFL